MRLLFICTGNLCRSPVAAALMRTWRVRESETLSAEIEIESAGLAARPDMPMAQHSARAAVELGGDPDFVEAHRSRAIAPAELHDADLVLTMTRGQRARVLQVSPRGLRYTFTLSEAAALIERIDTATLGDLALPDRAGELARRLDAARAGRRGEVGDDIPDPMGCSFAVHRRVAARVADELRPLARVLLTPTAPAFMPG